MRILLVVLLTLVSKMLFSQSSKVQVKLFVPAHAKNVIKSDDKLIIHFLTFPDDTMKIRKSVTAKRIKENIYEFDLPATKFHHIGFSIGNFSYGMICINNEKGDAGETYDFNILLVNEKNDFSNIRFLPPCISTDEDE